MTVKSSAPAYANKRWTGCEPTGPDPAMQAMLSRLDEGLAKMQGLKISAQLALDAEADRPTIGAFLYGTEAALDRRGRGAARVFASPPPPPPASLWGGGG